MMLSVNTVTPQMMWILSFVNHVGIKYKVKTPTGVFLLDFDYNYLKISRYD